MTEDAGKNKSVNSTTRRDFMKLSAGALAGAAVLGSSKSVIADDFSPDGHDDSVGGSGSRATKAYRLKKKAAQQHLSYTSTIGDQLDNNDETRYEELRFYSSFTKTLPCNRFGEVRASAFRKLQKAMRKGRQQHLDSIPQDDDAERKLANPQGAFRYEMAGLDSHATRITPSWAFRSAESAGEIAEVYWQALVRDIPFTEYQSSSLIDTAVSDLNRFQHPPAAAVRRRVAVDNLFRGETPGDLVGPYVSQFLWKEFSFGPVDVEQRYEVGLAATDFMTDERSWLHVQRGGYPSEDMLFEPNKRYINNNRALAEYVHRDALYQAYLHAALILLDYGVDALDEGNPYRSDTNNQEGFTSFGDPFVIDLVSKAANMALSSAWFQKWRVHRVLRPEAYGGRVHFQVTGQRNYELHSDILNSRALDEVFSRHGSYFCPQAYSEGSPTHPSFPAGHATIAGACVTVLKALFDEDYVIPDPVESDAFGTTLLAYNGGDLTIGNELNKLASNIAIGRDAAGVHYRQDGIQGLSAGEQQAIALLQDHSRAVHEASFDGFTLTRFDGQRVNIKDGLVIPV